jgi:hypothetical protein
VVATEWPQYRDLDVERVVGALAGDLVVDANGFLSASFAGEPRVRYTSVGRRPTR